MKVIAIIWILTAILSFSTCGWMVIHSILDKFWEGLILAFAEFLLGVCSVAIAIKFWLL